MVEDGFLTSVVGTTDAYRCHCARSVDVPRGARVFLGGNDEEMQEMSKEAWTSHRFLDSHYYFLFASFVLSAIYHPLCIGTRRLYTRRVLRRVRLCACVKIAPKPLFGRVAYLPNRASTLLPPTRTFANPILTRTSLDNLFCFSLPSCAVPLNPQTSFLYVWPLWVSFAMHSHSSGQMDASRCSKCGALSADQLSESFDISEIPGTRHHTLMHTNEPPGGSEISFIQSVITGTDGRLACLDVEISKLQKKLFQLRQERASMSRYRTRNTAILSPLRRMPPEVLGEIFSWTLPSITDELRRGKVDSTDSPWVLTGISNCWRAISLSTSSLWSQLVIDYADRATSPAYYSLAQVETRIQRAQKLKIHFYGCEYSVNSRPQIQMFQLLCRHSSRWEELSLELTSEMVPLLAALRGRLSLLERVRIHWSSSESQTAVQSIDFLQSAPSLVNFSTHNQYRFIPIALPIHQLTRYELDGPWQQHKGILKLAHNLIEAHIVIDFEEEGEEYSEGGTIDLLHLRRLHLSDLGFLNRLRTPALEGLSLWLTPDVGPDILRLLRSFLDLSACQLRSLCLSGFPDARATVEVLQKFSSITQLKIRIDDSGASKELNLLMSTLTASQLNRSRVVAPQLRSLRFACEKQGSINYKMYAKMLVSRRLGAADFALENAAFLTEGRGPNGAMFRALQGLRDGGLDLFILEGVEARREMSVWGYACSWTSDL